MVQNLQEQVSKYRPGEKVKVMLRRDGTMKQFEVVLRNLEGNTEIVKRTDVLEVLGASFEPVIRQGESVHWEFERIESNVRDQENLRKWV